mgnify:CR=1 FL=1
MLLHWQECVFAITRRQQLTIGNLQLARGSCTAVVGNNGSGKSALARALCGELTLESGECRQQPAAVRLSFEQQQALLGQLVQAQRAAARQRMAVGHGQHERLLEQELGVQLLVVHRHGQQQCSHLPLGQHSG